MGASLSARGPHGSSGLSANGVVGDAAYETPRIGSNGKDINASAQDASLDWSVLDKLAAQLHKQDAARQKQNQAELQQKLKADLEKQIEDNKVRKERERIEDNKHLTAEKEFTQNWKESEAAKLK